jgi:DTW domain-containing protein YfiP/GNAT superfamily N-acetyltransferase
VSPATRIVSSSSLVEDDVKLIEDQSATKSPFGNFQVPNERAELLNRHLQMLLSNDEIVGNSIRSIDIMEASLKLMTRVDPSTTTLTSGADPRFGRPALKTYHTFVFSDRYDGDNAILLDGLAPKTAKQIYNMVKQRIYKHKGILEPPKTTNSHDDENNITNSVLQTNPPQHFRDKITNSIAKGERRARERSHRKLREVCSGCSRPFNLCLCDALANETATNNWIQSSRVIVLQHPNEFRKKHTSTVPLLKLVLGNDNVRVKVGYEFSKEDILLGTNGEDDDHRPIMLFPGPDAIDLDKYAAIQQQEQNPNDIRSDDTKGNQICQERKTTLVLIDGTWAEAKRIIRKSPEVLEACQMVQFAFDDEEETSDQMTPAKSRSIYDAMRKEPEEHCLSTLEACGQALRIIEGETRGPAIQDHLNSVLSRHVELHLRNARESSQSRHNRDTTSRDEKLRRAKQIERTIYGSTTNEETDHDSSFNENRPKGVHRRMISTTAEATTIAESPTRFHRLDNGESVTIRRLTHEDVPLLDAWWENGGTSKSILTLTRSINADYDMGIGANLGIVDENDPNKLIACIVRYESGPLGTLYVDEKHRGKGYGTALLAEATQIIAKKSSEHNPPLECTAYIKDNNSASERVFEKVGWERDDPTVKKRSGRRRSNRKWIYPPCSQ